MEEEVTASRAWELSLVLVGSGLSICVSCSVHFCIHSLALVLPSGGVIAVSVINNALLDTEQISVRHLGLRKSVLSL